MSWDISRINAPTGIRRLWVEVFVKVIYRLVRIFRVTGSGCPRFCVMSLNAYFTHIVAHGFNSHMKAVFTQYHDDLGAP